MLKTLLVLFLATLGLASASCEGRIGWYSSHEIADEIAKEHGVEAAERWLTEEYGAEEARRWRQARDRGKSGE